MTVFLKISNVDFHGNAYTANLQIGSNKGVDGNPANWFELVGENGADDSGTWDWGRDAPPCRSSLLTIFRNF